MQRRLIAEWEKQKAVWIAFPHEESDWIEYLDEAQSEFVGLIQNIARFTPVVAICQDASKTASLFVSVQNIRFLEVRTNDTWIRDYGPISVETGDSVEYLDFGFNGWGLKFAANHDNALSRILYKNGELENLKTLGMILEGGSIESNSRGELLTTSKCLLEANRNPSMSKQDITAKLKTLFGLQKVHFLEHGYLIGDDTDGHIDTLARFVSPNEIVYVKCHDEADEHYKELSKMEEELKNLRDTNNQPFILYAIPLPTRIEYENERLPATYANFLITNGGVIVPAYGLESDEEVMVILQNIFKDKEVVLSPSSILIRQHGSIHCSTMQLH